MSTVAVIHAKGTSERLPNKNLRWLGGLPLIAHAIRNAKNSKADLVVVDSEDERILDVGIEFGAIPLLRPLYLARNEITGDDLAYWQAQNYPSSEVIVQVVPTSPFTKPETINACIFAVKMGTNSSFTGRIEEQYTWSERVKGGDFLPDYMDRMGKIKNSNELSPTFIESTGVYAFKPGFALKQHRRIDWLSFHVFLISQEEAVDIDTEKDFKFAEVVWKGLQNSKEDTEEKEASSLVTDQALMELIRRD
ncbi:MAG: acylneuraminate cytidylyltransferase family protein [Candidatus Thorarchaeota archaeon]|jgi:CMP-N-acetylneuraminic acid synthetase